VGGKEKGEERGNPKKRTLGSLNVGGGEKKGGEIRAWNSALGSEKRKKKRMGSERKRRANLSALQARGEREGRKRFLSGQVLRGKTLLPSVKKEGRGRGRDGP